MGKIYARTILRGMGDGRGRKLSDVPETWYAATVEALREMCDEETFENIIAEANRL